MTVLDVNADGLPDLATANEGTSGVGGLTVLMNANVAGSNAITFSAPAGFDGGPGPTSVATADFNADGKPDLVDVTPNGAEPVHVFTEHHGSGLRDPVLRSRGRSSAPAPRRCRSRLPDLNRDGRPDIVTANVGQQRRPVASRSSSTRPRPGATVPGFDGPFPVATPGRRRSS